MGYATGPGLDPLPSGLAEVADFDPISPDPCYSYPVDMQNRTFVKLGVDFTKGSLTNCILSIEVWNGVEWVADYSADGSSQWSYTMTANKNISILVGDTTDEIEAPVPFAWRFFRVKIDPTGTATGSSITIRAAAK